MNAGLTILLGIRGPESRNKWLVGLCSCKSIIWSTSVAVDFLVCIDHILVSWCTFRIDMEICSASY